MHIIIKYASAVVLMFFLVIPAQAQTSTLVGDRYEATTALKICTAVNCNLSFPQFNLPPNITGFLLIEEISCSVSSQTTVFKALYGPTALPELSIGGKIGSLLYNGFPYDDVNKLYSSTFHGDPGMIIGPTRYMTLNFSVNAHPTLRVFNSYVVCRMSGRIIR